MHLWVELMQVVGRAATLTVLADGIYRGVISGSATDSVRWFSE